MADTWDLQQRLQDTETTDTGCRGIERWRVEGAGEQDEAHFQFWKTRAVGLRSRARGKANFCAQTPISVLIPHCLPPATAAGNRSQRYIVLYVSVNSENRSQNRTIYQFHRNCESSVEGSVARVLSRGCCTAKMFCSEDYDEQNSMAGACGRGAAGTKRQAVPGSGLLRNA